MGRGHRAGATCIANSFLYSVTEWFLAKVRWVPIVYHLPSVIFASLRGFPTSAQRCTSLPSRRATVRIWFPRVGRGIATETASISLAAKNIELAKRRRIVNISVLCALLRSLLGLRIETSLAASPAAFTRRLRLGKEAPGRFRYPFCLFWILDSSRIHFCIRPGLNGFSLEGCIGYEVKIICLRRLRFFARLFLLTLLRLYSPFDSSGQGYTVGIAGVSVPALFLRFLVAKKN